MPASDVPWALHTVHVCIVALEALCLQGTHTVVNPYEDLTYVTVFNTIAAPSTVLIITLRMITLRRSLSPNDSCLASLDLLRSISHSVDASSKSIRRALVTNRDSLSTAAGATRLPVRRMVAQVTVHMKSLLDSLDDVKKVVTKEEDETDEVLQSSPHRRARDGDDYKDVGESPTKKHARGEQTSTSSSGLTPVVASMRVDHAPTTPTPSSRMRTKKTQRTSSSVSKRGSISVPILKSSAISTEADMEGVEFAFTLSGRHEFSLASTQPHGAALDQPSHPLLPASTTFLETAFLPAQIVDPSSSAATADAEVAPATEISLPPLLPMAELPSADSLYAASLSSCDTDHADNNANAIPSLPSRPSFIAALGTHLLPSRPESPGASTPLTVVNQLLPSAVPASLPMRPDSSRQRNVHDGPGSVTNARLVKTSHVSGKTKTTSPTKGTGKSSPEKRQQRQAAIVTANRCKLLRPPEGSYLRKGRRHAVQEPQVPEPPKPFRYQPQPAFDEMFAAPAPRTSELPAQNLLVMPDPIEPNWSALVSERRGMSLHPLGEPIDLVRQPSYDMRNPWRAEDYDVWPARKVEVEPENLLSVAFKHVGRFFGSGQ